MQLPSTHIPASPATLPDPEVLPGWDPAWSQLVTVLGEDGSHTFHVLDTAPALAKLGRTPTGTILAVHGNPTWSYLWRSLATATLANAADPEYTGPIWRLVAPDQLDMGYSERLAHAGLPVPASAQQPGVSTDRGYRTLTGRITDLDALVRHLGLDRDAAAGQPLLTLGHDWGGVISLGWATRNADLVSGIMTLNTAVHHQADQPIPAPLQAALAGPLLPGSTVLTDAFLRVTTGLGNPALDPDVRQAFHAPYWSAEQRGGIGGFVADIPVDPAHGSYPELQRIGEDIAAYGRTGKPALILWGPKDPVFLDRYLADLLDRLPAADLHRFEKAGHLLPEDADITAPILLWAEQVVTGTKPSRTPAGDTTEEAPPLWHFLDTWADKSDTALVDMAGRTAGRVSWSRLSAVVNAIASGLYDHGLRPGDRISLLVPPGRDLTAILYACLRLGAVGVVADAGLGIAGMTRAVRAARPDWIIGETPGLSVARAQNWPGRRISVTTLPRLGAAALKVETSIYQLIAAHDGQRYDGPAPTKDDPAAILFTSGSTGPAKGVMYTQGRLANLTRLLRDVFNVRPGSSLLAGFAPFALLGPAIGATSTTPDMDVTKPATLTAVKVADAAAAANATMVFASPAALRNVVATADQLSPAQRNTLAGIELVLSAGAPVHPDLVAEVGKLFTGADFHSPYGMTESLLLADIDAAAITELNATGTEDGVCVGRPVSPVRMVIAPLNPDGSASTKLLEGPEAAGVLGEVVISAPHMKAGYDRLWYTDARSRRDTVDGLEWHRTEDIGHLDADGRLWIEGRLQHVVTTADGPVAPGGPEARIDALHAVARSAIVGVGPAGTQAVVAVIEPATGPGLKRLKRGVAPTELAAQVRAAAAPIPVAAVLVTDSVPVDIRHQSKINRPRLAVWADGILAGGKVGRP
ncbi:alpha/beta fold hydrolase [Micrococcoides hystricis]|uniref:Alpha/beta fold hydrolase n=1 Tax=Micrococcoides hystricis TaxID=1572761 RepID=A0ABV6PB01_9MICC